MGSEIFNLKSLNLEDTVVRGARLSIKNASSTRTIDVNPGDDPVVKTGEVGVNKDYLIQASLIGNDLNGYGTFINNSDIIRGYTGAQNLVYGDKIKLDSDKTAYSVTGIQGTDVYITEKYTKESTTDPDVKSGVCSIEKFYLDSVKYEHINKNIVYNKDESEWSITGAQMSDPVVAPSDTFEFDTGMALQFKKGVSKKKPDIATVLSSYKTLVSNNTSPILDVSLSPMPYPHSSLQVLMGKTGEEVKKAVEGEDYLVNYTNGSEIVYPIPPYEERDVAYIKFLDKITDEVQVSSIDSSFSGSMVISKKVVEEDTTLTKPVQDIIPTDDFSIKVGGSEKTGNTDYIINNNAGMVTFVEHKNRESLIDTLTYPKKLIWDGISVIKGVREDSVTNAENLVIPGVSGISGIDYTIYFEDTDSSNMVRDTDFIIDPESGAFALVSPTKKDEAVLVSYYVEGDDIKNEKIELGQMRLNSFPLVVSSLILTKKYTVISDNGTPTTKTRVLIEGSDFNASYVTGYIELVPSNESTVDLRASYTPMTQINCVVQSIPDSSNYKYTIIDDVFTFSQDDISSKKILFKVNNPVVSIPKKILFDSDKINSNYNFLGSITPGGIVNIQVKDTDRYFILSGAKYDDIKKEITLDSFLNQEAPHDGDIVVGSYTIESDILPYAPVLLMYTIINAGDTSFLIEGYDKTDILRAGIILRVDNKDPQSTNYYVIKNVSYQKQSTNIEIYGTFTDTAIDPIFSVFDAQINWQDLSQDVVVDTTVPVGSEQLILNGGSLFIKTNFKKDGLLLIGDQEVYTITSIETKGAQSKIGIYPKLRSILSSNIKFSRLPVIEVGTTTLPAEKLILNDMEQPAFSLWYQSPEGFEGSAKILFIKGKIVINEYVSGVKNPIPYEFFISDYTDVYDLSKAIQSTQSTFRDNVPGMGVPDYLPFTMMYSGKESYFLSSGIWDPESLIPFEEETQVTLPYTFKIVPELYSGKLGDINKRKMVIDTDYTIDNGVIELVTPVESLDRFQLSYMGLDNLYENESDFITCTCRFLRALPIGYRLDVYLEYINIDQFYIQKLTERKFSEIVTVPQIEQLVEQKGSSGGQGTDSGATNDSVAVYEGGVADINYLLRDEYIKKQLYVRFFKWYKQRLRGLSAELQLGLGFKFGHSNAIGDTGEYYSIDDSYVENEDYTLTTDKDIEQITNGFSKYFPIGYEGSAPDYYHRFNKEYLSFNEVYCCNVTYRDSTNKVVTVGLVKSDRPYWNKTSDLIFKVWEDNYLNKNLVGSYSVDVPEGDRSFSPSNYTFLRVVDSGDRIKIEDSKSYYTISDIVSPSDKSYEYILLSKALTDKGIKTYDIVDNKDVSFDNLVENLPPDGYKIWINRQDKEDFPMSDDCGSLGATAYGEPIEGLLKDGRRIKKPFLANLLRLFFPFPSLPDPSTNFKVMVKKDSEASWEELGTIDLSKLTFKEERNIDDVLDALRYDFTEKFTVPIVPPYTVYDIKETSDKGFFRYFYLSLERVYDSNSSSGHYHSIVLRAKDRNWWFKIVNGGEDPIIADYGFSEEKIYKNFYDPDNIYKKLLIEKQAWQTEEMIIRDLYDHSDKLARAYDQGDINSINSKYRDYLAMPEGSSTQGISDILRVRIPAYEKQLRFLIDEVGPVFRTMYPDLVHAEDVATPDIDLTYNQTLYAWNLYNDFYAKYGFYYNLNEDNNYLWKNDYIRWVLSLEKGILYQDIAKRMYEYDTKILTVGLKEAPTIKVALMAQSLYTIINPKISVSSTYDGKYISLTFSVLKNDNTTEDLSCLVYLYSNSSLNGVPTIMYKSLSEICTEINIYKYQGINIFYASNIFEHYENNVASKISLISDVSIDPLFGVSLNSTNVADHRESDSRVLFLNKNIEDRVYTNQVRKLPGFNITYLGNYYFLKYGTPGFTISLNYSYDTKNFRYGVFLDETGNKILIVSYEQGSESISNTFLMYNKNGSEYTYKTISELVSEINNSDDFYAEAAYSYAGYSCDKFIVTSDYIPSTGWYLTPYITTNSIYDNIDKDVNQFYYRVYTDASGIKKLDITFYELTKEGNNLSQGLDVSNTFTFSLQNYDGSFKTLAMLCSEVSSCTYRGERILSSLPVYEAVPKENLSTSFIVADNTLLSVGYDWVSTVYVDTYTEAISGSDSNSRTISNIKNAEFSFPMYTANGNINKAAIEDIPVSGKWEVVNNKEVIEISCIDGSSWSVSFSDYDSGDFKSYMLPQDMLALIDSGKSISEEQYNQIRVIEDRPVVTVLKELVLTRHGTDKDSIVRFNLRKYSTINELSQAIALAKFNADGEFDTSGNRAFFTSSIIGDANVEGLYKSYELSTEYSPVIKSFTVNMEDGTSVYKSNQLVGWKLIEENLPLNLKFKIKMSAKKYSHGQTHKFIMNNPEQAYTDTLYNNPQGFRRDTLAFDIYSWDYDARYEVKDNWIYFKSSSIDYSSIFDLGQPDKTLGYGIPLAGSGHSQAPDNESLIDLVGRINSSIVSAYFYANLKFTRDDKTRPGYFEYGYLPNFYLNIPRSNLDNIMLKDDTVMSVSPGTGYKFTDSNITVNDSADTFTISCDWEFYYNYEHTFFFNESANSTIGNLASSINSALAPEIGLSLIEAEADPTSLGILSSMSRSLIPSYTDKSVTTLDEDIYMNVSSVRVPALLLKIRNASGTNFVISSASYRIPVTKDRIIIKCAVTYQSTFGPTVYSTGSYTIGTLSTYLASIVPYSDSAFTPLFTSSVESNGFSAYSANRLMSISDTINVQGTKLIAKLNDLPAFRVLNMVSEGTLVISDTSVGLTTYKSFSKLLSFGNYLHSMVDSVKGDYNEGFLSCGVLPLKISSTDTGKLDIASYSLVSNNSPAHVYLGVLGDIRFVQISDHNLHTQYNYIKERLGMPWSDSRGNLMYDYYTPEKFNENNQCAIDLNNFLGYLRTGRYNQIKNSIINEAVISNKYLWLYMKFHKEFGCDQRAKMLKDAIQKGETDIETLNQVL